MVELTRSFELENKPVDEDHRGLIALVNDIIKVLDEGCPEECAQLVPDFVAFTKKHFQREEALLERYDYPQLAKHREHHRRLHDNLENLLKLAANVTESEPARQSLRKELVYFMMDDVINADLDFKPFLSEAAPKDATK